MSGQRLIQMHGVPGSGKSTLARALGAELGAVVIDKDLIATGALRGGVPFAGAGGVAYEALWLLLPSLLEQGFSVIHDSPCFWPNIEETGRAIAQRADAQYAMIECVCDDGEIDRRLSSRRALESNPTARGAGAGRPGMYTPSCERLVVDGTRAVGELVADCVGYLRNQAVPA
jgi:predicted kinase